MIMYFHETDMPSDKAMIKFLWQNYFHDSYITAITFEGKDIIITLQSDRDCQEAYEKNPATCTWDHRNEHKSEKYTYHLIFKNVDYYTQENDNSYFIYSSGIFKQCIYLDGYFKDTHFRKMLSKERNYHLYHFIISTTSGYIDILFKKFNIRKKQGHVNYSHEVYPAKTKKMMEALFSREKIKPNEIDIVHNEIECFNLSEDVDLDDTSMIDKLQVLHFLEDKDILKYLRLVINLYPNFECTSVFVAYLLGFYGDKSDISKVKDIYFKTTDIDKRYILESIERLENI